MPVQLGLLGGLRPGCCWYLPLPVLPADPGASCQAHHMFLKTRMDSSVCPEAFTNPELFPAVTWTGSLSGSTPGQGHSHGGPGLTSTQRKGWGSWDLSCKDRGSH